MSAISIAERRVVRPVIARLIEAGFTLVYFDGELSQKPTQSVQKIMDELGACGEEYIRAYRDGKYFGSLFLVYGNAPDEVFCDYSVKLGEYVSPADWANPEGPF